MQSSMEANSVKTANGYYLVIVPNKTSGLQIRVVTKDRKCSCGRRECKHILAVQAYLKAGGARAETKPHAAGKTSPPRLTECPICGKPIVYGKYPWSAADIWHCEDSSHYWLHRVESRDGTARKFMTEKTPTNITGIYEMTVDEYKQYLDRLSEVRVAY